MKIPRLLSGLAVLLCVGTPSGFSLHAQTAPGKPIAMPAPTVQSNAPTIAPLPVKYVGPPTVGDITPGDLMTRLYKFADDSMMGREAGTIWNDKGTDYIASEVKRLGLKPAGENGTYFQQVMIKRELDSAATLSIDDKTLALWTDFAPRDQGVPTRSFKNARAVWGGVYGDAATYLPKSDAKNRVVIMRVGNGPDGQPSYSAISRIMMTTRYSEAAAIAVVMLDFAPAGYVDLLKETTLGVRASQTPNAATKATAKPTFVYISQAVADAMLGLTRDDVVTGKLGKLVSGTMQFRETSAPGRNVIALLEGSDGKLRKEYVAIGAHNDHVGFNHRPADHDSIKAFKQIAQPQGADSPLLPVSLDQRNAIRALTDSLHAQHPARLDSIFNGADDDGSGSMAVLEIAEKFATMQQRPRRSILFVWHVGEELGMLGSGYFTDHPTAPREKIVAQLNVDMIGRGAATDVTGQTLSGEFTHGGDGYVQLVGSRRNSTELGDLLERINTEQKHGLHFDYSMDANGHPQNIYCRSDHYEYARYGIPIAFFTTGGHADYHQVTDEPQYIQYENYARVTNFVQSTALYIANMSHRPVVDKPQPNPRGTCRQ